MLSIRRIGADYQSQDPAIGQSVAADQEVPLAQATELFSSSFCLKWVDESVTLTVVSKRRNNQLDLMRAVTTDAVQLYQLPQPKSCLFCTKN